MKWLAVTGLVVILVPIAGVVPQPRAVAQDAVRGARVFDTSGSKSKPCAPVDAGHSRFVRGGCRARAYDFSTQLSIRTAFGMMRFGNCATLFDLSIAAGGRMWLDNLRIGGEQPCSDVWPCSPPEVIALRKTPLDTPPLGLVPPWQGKLLTAQGGGFAGRFGFCVDTCVGRYDGEVHVKLVRKDGAWVMRARSAGVGATGLAVDADWDMIEPSNFALKPAGR
jgi:hypothetical protein